MMICEFKMAILASGGTSASAPTLAAIFTLINDALIAENLPVIGFPNPLLYALQNVSSKESAVLGLRSSKVF